MERNLYSSHRPFFSVCGCGINSLCCARFPQVDLRIRCKLRWRVVARKSFWSTEFNEIVGQFSWKIILEFSELKNEIRFFVLKSNFKSGPMQVTYRLTPRHFKVNLFRLSIIKHLHNISTVIKFTWKPFPGRHMNERRGRKTSKAFTTQFSSPPTGINKNSLITNVQNQ